MSELKKGFYLVTADGINTMLRWDGEDWVDMRGIRPCFKEVVQTRYCGENNPVFEQDKPVASAWMYQGEMVNAFPWPPNDPRGCDNDKYWEGKGYTSEPLYTYPQPRKPLTNEQIDEIADTVANMPLVGIVNDFRTRFARAIEAVHGIKE